MQPRLATRHALHARRQLSASTVPAPVAPARPWRLTRRLSNSGKLALFRAAASNELGPGCYVLKHLAAADDPIAAAMLHRQHAISGDVSHPNLNSVLAGDFSASKPFLVLPYLEGISLRRLIESRATAPHVLSTSYALLLVRQVA